VYGIFMKISKNKLFLLNMIKHKFNGGNFSEIFFYLNSNNFEEQFYQK